VILPEPVQTCYLQRRISGTSLPEQVTNQEDSAFSCAEYPKRAW